MSSPEIKNDSGESKLTNCESIEASLDVQLKKVKTYNSKKRQPRKSPSGAK